MALLVIFLFLAVLGHLYYSSRLGFLVLSRSSRIEVNGVRTSGDLLEGRGVALLTIRGGRKEQSYLLHFEGDADQNGDMGAVRDCGSWVAPRVYVLPETRSYPPCAGLSNGRSKPRWPLINRGRSIEFVLPDSSHVEIHR